MSLTIWHEASRTGTSATNTMLPAYLLQGIQRHKDPVVELLSNSGVREQRIDGCCGASGFAFFADRLKGKLNYGNTAAE